MKTIVILFDENNKYEEEKVFDGKSALELCRLAADSLNLPVQVLNAQKDGLFTISSLFDALKNIAESENAQTVVFSYADCPFLNKAITQELLATHSDYKAEYTFAEGYPYGFTPQVLDCGTIAILAELAKTTAAQTGAQKITRTSVFDLIKTDINSFEVETVLAPVDWRLLRYSFDCARKEHLLACTQLYKACANKSELFNNDIVELSKKAAENPDILKTVPAFYNLQLAQKCNGSCSCCPYPKALKEKEGCLPADSDKIMDTDKAFNLIQQIADFSGEAVIGLSAWGECFNHPDLLKIIEKILSYQGLSVLIEADACAIPADFAGAVKELVEKAPERTNGWQKLMIVAAIDGFSEQTCRTLRSKDFDLKKAVSAVEALEQAVPGSVYPQFVRMNANEAELESFFRYWNEKTNESHGNFILQKYNSFAGILKNEEPADLSPLERNVCWHLRRDMTILYNGDVPMCWSCILENIQGNVFEQGIQAVWKKSDDEIKNQICRKYCEKCGGCDEFYTFNF